MARKLPKETKVPREEKKSFKIEDPVTEKIEYEFLTEKEANSLRRNGLLVTEG